MCGRFVVDVKGADWAALSRELALDGAAAPPSRYNLAPTQAMLGLAPPPAGSGDGAKGPRAQVLPLTFGMKLGSSSLVINARSETVTDKPMFRHLLASNRVLVLATAFYEWAPATGTSKRKQPMCFSLPGQTPFFFAALKEKRAAEPPGAVIVTTAANATVAPSHARMPVILTLAEGQRWLDREADVGEALSLLQPYAGKMTAWAVGLQVNNPRHDAPDCLAKAP